MQILSQCDEIFELHFFMFQIHPGAPTTVNRLRLPLKGQSGEILLGHIYHERKDLKYKMRQLCD